MLCSGLDPASHQFENDVYQYLALRNTDAEFVDVIHTSNNKIVLRLGYNSPIGHVDFYPNAGQNQPGCSPDPLGKCHYNIYYFMFIFISLEKT